ncbi:MAG: hypothetical protein WDO69_01265 [Pseudomonadota bacterium]
MRRIEGVLLQSVLDAQGVHRFDQAQVEALARRLERGEVTIWQALRGSPDKLDSDFDSEQRHVPPELSELARQMQALRGELEEERRLHRRELEALKAEHEREQAEHAAERREFDAQVSEFMALANELTD